MVGQRAVTPRVRIDKLRFIDMMWTCGPLPQHRALAGRTPGVPLPNKEHAMSGTDKPLIAVAGATSKQGRSVVTSLLESGSFRVRALTRDAGSRQAMNLARMGAEIVEASLDCGHRQLLDAFRSADGAFLMTPPVAPPSTEEFTLGSRLADVAVEAGVQHLVFRALENVEERSAGTKYAPHFTDKARVADHIRTLPVGHTFVMLSFF